MVAPLPNAKGPATPDIDSLSSLAPVTLIIGGARSGKSKHGEALIENCRAGGGAKPLYIATAEAGDGEMAARIEKHKRRRGVRWETLEEPLEIAAALEANGRADRAILVDCLTLWLSNLMGKGRDIAAETARLLGALDDLEGPVVLIANEVGLGIVPEGALAREFRDRAGELNQAMAERAERVVFIAAGIAMTIKDAAPTGAAMGLRAIGGGGGA
ncbi:MAG: bifunctional adenosylcobinamide kinase/adenosylcobinamide-phosphate guanylyltransferase [Proteobacteria bacterium]|nr:bifunctional adenosylcobinamide kinase/adenosylcobinamide-phosphate guanylyltransferase [Pseudomonadota bacterium]